MVLGKLPEPGRPTIGITVGQGPPALAVGAGGCWLDIFTLIYPFSPLSPSLWETARYRLKYCLKGPLNPKQPTNQNPCYQTNADGENRVSTPESRRLVYILKPSRTFQDLAQIALINKNLTNQTHTTKCSATLKVDEFYLCSLCKLIFSKSRHYNYSHFFKAYRYTALFSRHFY